MATDIDYSKLSNEQLDALLLQQENLPELIEEQKTAQIDKEERNTWQSKLDNYLGETDWTDYAAAGFDLLTTLLAPELKLPYKVGKIALKQGSKAYQTGKEQGLFNKPSEELLKLPPDLSEIPVIGKIADKLGKSIEKGVNSNAMNAIVDAGATGGKLLGKGAQKIIRGTGNVIEQIPIVGSGITKTRERKFREHQANKKHKDTQLDKFYNSKTEAEAIERFKEFNKEHPNDPIKQEILERFKKEIAKGNTSGSTSADQLSTSVDQLKSQKVETEIAKQQNYQAKTEHIQSKTVTENTKRRIYEETHNEKLKQGETVNALDIATKAEKLLNEKHKGEVLQSKKGQEILKQYILSHREQGHIISNEGKVIKNINEFNKALKSFEEINTQKSRTNLVNKQADKTAEGVKTQEANTNLVNEKTNTQAAKTKEVESKTNLNQGKLNSNSLKDLQTIGRIVEQHININQKTKTNPITAEHKQVNLDISKKRLEALKGQSFEDIVKYLAEHKGFAENIANHINKANKETAPNPSVKEPQNKQTAVDNIVSEFKPVQEKSGQTPQPSTKKSTKPEKSNQVENIANNISPNIKTNKNNNADDTWVQRVNNNKKNDKKPPKIEEKETDNTITLDNQESVQNTPLNANKKKNKTVTQEEDPGVDITVANRKENITIKDQNSFSGALFRIRKALKRVSEYYENRVENGQNTQRIHENKEIRDEELPVLFEYINRKKKENKYEVPIDYRDTEKNGLLGGTLFSNIEKYLKKPKEYRNAVSKQSILEKTKKVAEKTNTKELQLELKNAEKEFKKALKQLEDALKEEK